MSFIVARSLNENGAGSDLVSMGTSLLFLCKLLLISMRNLIRILTFLIQLCAFIIVTWHLNESEAGGDLILIETSLLLYKFLLITVWEQHH